LPELVNHVEKFHYDENHKKGKSLAKKKKFKKN